MPNSNIFYTVALVSECRRVDDRDKVGLTEYVAAADESAASPEIAT
jgi:hypothetical protein